MTSATVMTPRQALFKFLQGRPDWEQDAVRRLYELGALGPVDCLEVYDLFRAQTGLPARKDAFAGAAMALNPDALPERADAADALILKKIHGVQNVARLATGQAIHVGPNLTLIYGENGAGKSGYTRILKKACGARANNGELILADVREANYAAKGPGRIAVDCAAAGGGDVSVAWDTQLKIPDDLLRRVQVFDSTVATHLIAKENDLPVVPYDFDLLDKLASDVFAAIKTLLKADRDRLDERIGELLTSLPGAFGAQDAIRAMKPTIDIAQIEQQLTAFDDAEAAKFDQLHDLLHDRNRQIKDLSRDIQNLDKVIDWLKKAHPQLSATGTKVYREKIAALAAADAAVTSLLPQAFGTVEALRDATFADLGGDAWQVMWTAARAFAATTGTMDAGDHCPLCLQTLDAAAQARFAAFQTFIEKTVIKTRDELRAEVARIEKGVAGIFYPYLNAEILPCFAHDKLAQAAVQACYEDMALAKDNLRKAIAAPASMDTLEWPAVEDVTPLLQALRDDKQRLLDEANSFDSDPLAPQKKDAYQRLGCRKTLAPHKDTVLKILKDRQISSKHGDAEKTLETAPLSRQKRALMDKYFNDRFIAAFETEREALGLRFQVRANVTQAAAVSRHKPVLQDCHHKKIDDILSEGERRTLALAAFLTELEIADAKDPVIFDDPVSSLDHLYRESVSERLVRLALSRQVIIFTHDLTFFVEMQAKAESHGCNINEAYLKTEFAATGIISDTLPWDAQKLGNRIGTFDALYKEVKQMYEENDPNYGMKARMLGGDIRLAWERLIEEWLFKNVVTRYRKSIETKRLKEIAITPEILAEIERGMTETSNWAHDKAQAFQVSPPSLAAIKTAIERIKKCRGLIGDAKPLAATPKAA